MTGTLTAAAVLAAAVAAAGAPAAPGRPRPKPIVDHAVVPAGGAACRHCGDAACRVHGGHLAGCRDGLCEPHCPVRPSQYGFYRTQWRRWPGQGVMPASAEEAATPVAPPPAQVPTVDEESPRPADVSPSQDEPDATASEAPTGPRTKGSLPTDPLPEAEGDVPPPRPVAPEDGPAVPPTPPGEPPIPRAAEDAAGLLDQSAAPADDADIALTAGAMRYPAPVGRSLATGAAPWRLERGVGQRAADSGRGL